MTTLCAYGTREEWLEAAVGRLRPDFDRVGLPLPAKVRVSVGWARTAGKGVGWCYPSGSAEDTVPNLFISPEMSEPIDVLATLVHELVHAADDCKSGHTGQFRKTAKALGLTGKMTASNPGPELTERLATLADELGPFPHGKMHGRPADAPKKQTTRMLKLECPEDGYIVRTTQKWLALGMPTCPCGEEMTAPE